MFCGSQIFTQPILVASPILSKGSAGLSSFLIRQTSYSRGFQGYFKNWEILESIWKIGRYPIKVSEVHSSPKKRTDLVENTLKKSYR